jgi:hypothetical protein
MMSLHNDIDWQPPQTASFIHIRLIESTVHGHVAVASNSYTHTTWVIFWGSKSLVQSKWCHHFMVEADKPSNCFANTYYTYNGFDLHSYAVHGHTAVASNSYPHYLAHILGFWVTCGVKMMSLLHEWRWQPPQTASCIHLGLIQKLEAIHMLSMDMALAWNSYRLVWAKKVTLAAICLDISSASFWIRIN